MALINFITAVLVAQNFNEQYFASYLSIAALLAIISIPMQSVQNAYAVNVNGPLNDSSSPSGRHKITSVNTLILYLSIFWIISIPFLHVYSKIELLTLIASSSLFFILFPSTIVSGKLRQLERFSEWRWLLAATSMFQIPIVILATRFNLKLWSYLLLLCIPSFLYISLAALIFKISVSSDRKTVFVRWTSLLYSLVSSYSMQLPLIFSIKLLHDYEIGSILNFYFFSMTISLGGVFGTFYVPKFVKGGFVPKLLSKVNLLFCMPSLFLGLLLFSSFKGIVPALFGDNYTISLNGGFGLLFLLSSVIWSVYTSHAQIMLGSVRWRTMAGGIAILVFEWLYLIMFVNSFNEIVVVHFFTSVFQLLILNSEKTIRSS